MTKWQLLTFFGLLTILTLLIFWPIFFGKVNLNGNLLVSFYKLYGENLPYKPTGWDQLRIYLPFHKVTLDQLKSFNIPLWNPYAFSGHPHLADFQTAVFYPLNVFGFFLGQVTFWHLLRITPTILAAFFTYLFLSNLKLSKLASLFGAITFGFSPFILTWGEEVVMSPHSIIWLPLILFSIDRYLIGGNKKFLVLISLSLAASFFGGYMQTTIYLLIFVCVYLVFRVWNKNFFRNLKFWKIIGALVLGIIISAIQLLPSAELYFNSARANITLRQTLFSFLLPPESLITYLAPDFFGHPATWNFFRGGVAQYYEGILFIGIAPLIFALWAIFSKNKERLVTFLAIVALVFVSTTFDLPTSRLFLSLPIPFLSTSIANRILFIPAFCLAVLAAIGVEKWLAQRNKKIIKVIFVFGLIYVVIISALLIIKFFNFPFFNQGPFTSSKNVVVALRNLVIPLMVFGICSFLIICATYVSRWKSLATIGILVITFLHIFYFSQKYLSFADRRLIFPKVPILEFLQEKQSPAPDGTGHGYFRSWAIGGETFGNNFATQYDIFWPEGYDSLNNRAYSEFTFTMQGNRFDDYQQRADAGLGAIGTVEEIMGNKNRRKLMDIVGVKYVIANTNDSQIMEDNNFKKVFAPPAGEFAVFENLEVMPRAFLASNYEGPPQINNEGLSTQDKEKERIKLIPKKLLSDDFDFRNVLILEKPSPISAQFGSGTAQIISYKPQEIVIKTSSDQPKLLFLSDNYYPGWKATVDGDETEILRADYTFRAVPLTPGEHLVKFYYDSEIFKTGLLITLISLGMLGVFVFKVKSFKF